MSRVILRRHKDKLIRQGYPWIFKNLIYKTEGDPKTGDVVQIVGPEGHIYGQGFYHADAIIAVRFLTADPTKPINADFFRARLEIALTLRKAAFPDAPYARLVYGESDGLPGLTVDRYGDVLTWTCVSAAMAQRRDLLLGILEDLAQPTAIVERNDSWLRSRDGLEESKGILAGSYDAPVEIPEDGIRYTLDLMDAPLPQSLIDHRLHRPMVRRFAGGRRVLDAFAGEGGFGLHAAAGGAAAVHFLDVSQLALDRVRHNAEQSGVIKGCTFEQANALDRLGDLVKEGQTFEMVILDPPSFAKRRREVEDAMRSYQRLNITALQLLASGGLLATASSSTAVDEDDFVKMVEYAARKAGTRLRLLHRGGHPPDEPVLDTMAETRYLKFYLFEKLDDEVPGVREE